jgi:hypothetical protein
MSALAITPSSLGTFFAGESERRHEHRSEKLQSMPQTRFDLFGLSTASTASIIGVMSQAKISGESATYEITPESRVSSQLIGEIEQLKAGKPDEAQATDFAYKTARAVIESAYALVQLGRNVPRIVPEPWATTDDVGGIRVLWDSGSRKLRANFGARPELQTYLYYESDVEHDAEPLDAKSLKSRLRWLTAR